MNLSDLVNTDFAVHPDSSFTDPVSIQDGLEADVGTHLVVLPTEQGLEFNPAASRLLGSPVFGPASFYGKRN